MRVPYPFMWLTATLLAAAAAAGAQQYPNKPVRLIVPFAAGGSTEVLARVIAQKLTEGWGQPVVVDIRPGAGGTIGADIAARAAPDGYTLVMVAIGHAVNPTLYRKLPYDTERDFAPITLVANVTNALVVHPSVPASSVGELIALAKAKPGQLNYASGGAGSGAHLAAELFKWMAQVNIMHVPYKGVGQAVTDLLGGQMHIMMSTLPVVIQHVKSGRLRGLAVTTKTRSPTAPELPTIAEAGLPGYEMSQWFGLLAPAGTPQIVLGKLNREVAAVLGQRDVRERLAAQGAEATSNTPEEFARHIRSEIIKWAKVIKESGTRAD